MRINKKYMLAFFIILIIETLIAIFVHDVIIRPYVGDILVVVLMYTFIRGLVQQRIKLLPVYLFLFASAVELAQYFRIVEMLHLQDNRVLRTIIGTSFDTRDILCYLLAAVILIIWEGISDRR